uniref:Cilia and flagella associated protein 57 n=1 Tax=Latimeria chalumnae TaxID=7897 RepID=H2ZYU7_LATCH
FQVSFNPQDSTQMCVSGNGVFKLFRFTEGNLKQTNFQKLEPQVFLCHTWLSEEQLVVGTDTGKLFLFESGDLRRDINMAVKPSSPDSERQDMSSSLNMLDSQAPTLPRVTAIVSYSKGFACSAGPGTVYLYEKTEEKDSYRRGREIRIPPDQHSADPTRSEMQEIVTLCVSPSEEVLVASTSQSQLYTIALSSAEMSKVALRRSTTFTFFYFHFFILLGKDVTVLNPHGVSEALVSFKLVFSLLPSNLELYKEFQEEAHSISLHPSGHYILVGFSDKLRLMNLLIDDIRGFKEFTVRGCKECAFSSGGHLFAAVNGNVIHIYSCTTFDNVNNLKGHNGKVRSASSFGDVWEENQSRLISWGVIGKGTEHFINNVQARTTELLLIIQYNLVYLSPDSESLHNLNRYPWIPLFCLNEILRELPSGDMAYSTLVMSHSGRMVFVGTTMGAIRSMKYPLPVNREWNEYQAHCRNITRMAVTYDDQYLLTTSEDGCLLIWKISDKEGRGLKREKDVGYAEEVLITKSDLEEKVELAEQFPREVLKTMMMFQNLWRILMRHLKTKPSRFVVKFLGTCDTLKLLCVPQVLKTEKEKLQVKHEEDVVDMTDNHSKELQELEMSLSNQDESSSDNLVNALRASQITLGEESCSVFTARKALTSSTRDLTKSLSGRRNPKEANSPQSEDNARQQLREYEETKKQIEEDGDSEIQEMKIKYERKLREEREANLRLKGETGIMRKKVGGKCATVY